MDQKGGFFVENFLRIKKNKVYALALIQPTMKSFHINRIAIFYDKKPMLIQGLLD